MLAPPTASSGEWRGNLDAHTGAASTDNAQKGQHAHR